MSSLIVKVAQVDEIKPHPTADRMALAVVKGWQTCVGRNPDTGETTFKVGDKVVFFPPDTVLPGPLADRLGVTKYLAALAKNPDGTRPSGGRVTVAQLRGQKSYGFLAAPDDPNWPVGFDVVDHYGLTKWEPPQPSTDGDAEVPHPAFHKYTNIENYRNFPDLIAEGEEVVFTEKLHGKNTRVGLIRDQDENGDMVMTFMAGSHDVRRKEYAVFQKTVKDPVTKEPLLDENGEVVKREERRRSQFWDCLTDEVKNLLRDVSYDLGNANVIVFGEMIGVGVQDMSYGTRFGFRVFDISVNGSYLGWDQKVGLCRKWGVDFVPFLYRGPFSRAKVEEFVDGPTTMCREQENQSAFKGREGIVITPVKERINMDVGGSGRVILKAVSFAYLERKGGTEYH